MEDQIAGDLPVETSPEINEPEVSQEPTAAELLAAKDAELTRLAEERDNYRRAALKAKGKYKEEEPDEDDDDSLDAIIDRKVEEKLFDRRAQQLQQEKEALLQKTLKENEEMRNALRNRPGTGTRSGSNADKPSAGGPMYFSPDQEADLRARGLDPEVVLKNMTKAKGSPVAPQA